MSPVKHRWLPRLVLVALLVPLAVYSSLPNVPWFLFHVHGKVTGPATLENYTVALFYYTDVPDRPRGWNRVTGAYCYGANRYSALSDIALTKTDGSYSFSIDDCASVGLPFDTVAVAVVFPDTVVMGEPFRLSALKRDIVTAHVDQGCSGYDFVDGYIYQFPTKNVELPVEWVAR